MTRVLVLYNAPQAAADHPAAASEHGVVEHAVAQAETLRRLGHEVELLALPPDPGLLWRVLVEGPFSRRSESGADLATAIASSRGAVSAPLSERRLNVVLNLYEGTLDDPETESTIAGLLEWSGVPFTGCPASTLTLARAKHQAKRILQAAGLPTADFAVIDEPTKHCPLPFPVFVKPAAQDASVGVSRASLCLDVESFETQVRALFEQKLGPLLVERYLPGRELHVAVTALPMLRSFPPAEVRFTSAETPFLTYDAKWTPTSPEYRETPMSFGVSLPIEDELGRLARATFRVLGGRDYARVDFRLDADGQPMILELNPNPEIGPESCFGRMLESGGVSFDAFLAELIEHARVRGTSV